jgi:hypothetical protein
METKEYTTIDRAALGWPSGEWDGEPDKVQWPDAATGLPCLAVRNPDHGNWCGYVGVAEGHQAFGKDYGDVDVEVHGGLTFADACQPAETEARGICHIPSPGEPDHVWWLGFDCAHAWDYSPRHAMLALRPDGGMFARTHMERYRALAYVKRECASLASQLKAMA